jgi:hypothetical protein
LRIRLLRQIYVWILRVLNTVRRFIIRRVKEFIRRLRAIQPEAVLKAVKYVIITETQTRRVNAAPI